MTRAEIEQLVAQQERELAAFVEQANREIAFRQGQIAALVMLLQPTASQEEPAEAE
jgi:hypothetical protein